ncbi:hypothetical protein RCH14_001047 [Massilia sp. MP_M2]|uniref:hypothetical protein n=1 Tax=Massilia sp. MP_M2 TaxID=3071713 RepID=UPI00319DB42E
MHTIPFRIKAAFTGNLLLLLALLPAQAQLPAPSRTIYKCEVAGKIAYTDVPCLGAKRLDVVPARGVDKLSGTSRVGVTVAREYQQENMARALKPLLGMNEQQYATAVRRHGLDAGAQRECRALEAAIVDNERIEHQGPARESREALAHDTLSLRQRYHELRC